MNFCDNEHICSQNVCECVIYHFSIFLAQYNFFDNLIASRFKFSLSREVVKKNIALFVE